MKYDLLSKLVSGEVVTVPKTSSIVNYYQAYVRIIQYKVELHPYWFINSNKLFSNCESIDTTPRFINPTHNEKKDIFFNTKHKEDTREKLYISGKQIRDVKKKWFAES